MFNAVLHSNRTYLFKKYAPNACYDLDFWVHDSESRCQGGNILEWSVTRREGAWLSHLELTGHVSVSRA